MIKELTHIPKDKRKTKSIGIVSVNGRLMVGNRKELDKFKGAKKNEM